MPQNRIQRQRRANDEDDDCEIQEAMDISDEEGSTRINGIYIPPPAKRACTLDAKGTRLIVTKISNYFFKSYAHEQILGPFHKCFNSIVGPNGSGKSNVIDAMLFVFGYRATKIRSKKLAVLLHNSEHYSQVQSCTVSVHFAVIKDLEGDAYDIVPNSEFVISRTAHKDNSSYYQINSRRVQFKEVATQLRKHGIDLDHNRFLILQGEVEQIAMMKCKGQNEQETGMLEYLEDIIGTSRYKVPISQLEDRVEILADQRLEKLNRVKLVQKDLEELKRPMEEALEFLHLENTITLSKNFIYQWHIHDLDENNKKTEEEKSEFAIAQKELADKLANISNEKVLKEQSLKELSTNYNQLLKRKDKLKEAFDVANNKDVQLQAEMVQVNKRRNATKESLVKDRKKLEELMKVPEINEKTIEECIIKEEQMMEKKENLEAEVTRMLANLYNETKELQMKSVTLHTQLNELNEVVDDTKAAYTLAESELNIYISNEQNEKRKLENLGESYQALKQTIVQRGPAVSELEKKIPLTERSLKEAQSDLQDIKVEEGRLINDVRQKRMSLEETKSSMQATRSRGRVLDSLMQQKREGKCPDLFGRLGDLGAIDLKYDVAISTACGPLDNIVVDTVSTAQWCIEFLKQHDIGRATFIVLEKQEHLRQRANSQITTPENVPRLFDLIQIPDDRLRTAFYYALRDTLVAKDLEQASRIAYGAQKYRVVTLAGQLIEITGTMSGGGKTVLRGRMGQSITVTTANTKDVEKMENNLHRLEERINELRQKQATFETQISVLQPQLHEMKINYQKFSNELQSAKQQEPKLLEQLKRQEVKVQSTKANPATVKKLTKTVNENKLKYDEAAEAFGQVQVQVDKITAEITSKTSGKKKVIMKNLNEVTSTIDKCKAEVTRLRVGITIAARNAKKLTEKLGNMEQDITNAEDSLRNMKAQREEIENDARKLLETVEKISRQLVDLEEQCSALKTEVTNFTKQENEIKSEKIEVDQKCKTFDECIKDRKAEINQWKGKLTQLKLQEIPDQSMEELKTYAPEELLQRNIANAQRELNYNEEQLKNAKPNLNAITEYRKKQSVFVERSKELDKVSQEKAEVKEALDGVKRRRKEEFLDGYNIIKLKLKEMYQTITLGGDADFEMVDTCDPFTEGIQLNVRPPKKSWKNVSNLSGGEKTLSSLALVFALHHYKPSPLYVMDEIDAALDFKNVSIIGNYIKERTQNAQFIIISLRSNMFELCDRLIGIYKTFSCTKSVCIDPRCYNKERDNEQAVPAVQVNNVNENPNNNGVNNLENNQIIERSSEASITNVSVIAADSNGVTENSSEDSTSFNNQSEMIDCSIDSEEMEIDP